MKEKLATNLMTTSDVSAGDESELEEGEISDDIEIIKEVNLHSKTLHPAEVDKPFITLTVQKTLPADSNRTLSTTKRSSHSDKKTYQCLNSKRQRLNELSGRNNVSSFVRGSSREQRRDSSASKTKSKEGSQSSSKDSYSVKQVQSHSRSHQELPRNIYPNEKNLSRSTTNNTHTKDMFSSQSSRRDTKQDSCHKLPITPSYLRASNDSVDSVEKSTIVKDSERKWIPICELGAESRCSVESMDIDSLSEDEDELDLRLAALHSVVSVEDEELGLRLAALHSVVSNGSSKIKEISIEGPAVKQPSNSECPLSLEASPSFGVDKSQDAEEDDDEELLRAELLIAVALKQTKELEIKTQMEARQPEHVHSQPTQVPLVKIPPLSTKPSAPALLRKQAPLVIPKADRLVINLQEDSSSDDEDGDDDNVVNSITALLKSARQTVEQKDTTTTLGPSSSAFTQDMYLLPQNKQKEYQRLKMELVRRENMRLQQQTMTLPSRSLMLTQSQSDNIPKKSSDQTVDNPSTVTPPSSNMTSLPAAPVPTQINPAKISTSRAESHQGSPVVNQSVVLISSPENSAKENRLAKNSSVITKGSSISPVSNLPAQNSMSIKSAQLSSKTAETAASAAKMAVIKEQLIRKKRDLSSTKEDLKNQLEIVDNTRSLWMKSSQEVARLRALLQGAEETERQLLSQLTSHQEQTQHLKTKMQMVEKQIIVLHKGIGSNRTRRISSKLRSKPIHTPDPSTGIQGKNLSAPSVFRVKPRIVAKAIVNRNQSSVFAFHKTNAMTETCAATLERARSPLGGQTSVSNDARLIQHDEKWLFGTLGDEADGVTTSSFPAWSSQGHTIVSTAKDKFRVDPSLIICHKHLLDSSSCQDSNCGLQHLPLEEASSPPVLADTKADLAGSRIVLQLNEMTLPTAGELFSPLVCS